MDVFLLDKSSYIKEDVNMTKPSNYQKLLQKLKKSLKIYQKIMKYLFWIKIKKK